MTPSKNFVPTEGLSVRGEIGWHTHGTGDLKDTDIDLAIILESTQAIDPSYTTMVLWGLPLNEAGIVLDKEEYEVGLLEYKPADSNQELTLDLTQAVCTTIENSSEIYNLSVSGSTFSSIVEEKAGTYVKKGAI